jgi:hypothetical protein
VSSITAPQTVRVVLTGTTCRRYTHGEKEFEVAATNLRGVIKAMDKLYPGLGHHLEEDTNVAIDGDLYEIVYTQPVPAGCEVFFIPRIEGG